MKQRVAVHLVTKADLREGRDQLWDDPDGLTTWTPEKRAALLENPLSDHDDDPVQLVGLQGQRVIGKVDLIVGRLHLGPEMVPTLWTSAYYVPAPFRTTLIGVMLLLELQRLSATVSTCGVSHMALPILQRLKWSQLSLHRHVVVLRSRSVLNRWLPATSIAAPASRLVDGAAKAQRMVWSSWWERRLRGLRCQRVERMGPGLDAALATPADDLVVPHRSVAWINWLLEHRFSGDASFRKELFYVRDCDDQVVGYFAVKSRFHDTASQMGIRNVSLASLGDWAIFDPMRLGPDQLVLLAVRTLVGWAPDAIELCLEPGPVGRWLRRWGFPRVGALHVLVRASSASPLGASHLREQSSWRLRPAEGDNFFS